MVSIHTLWLPILLSTVAVFFASSLVWMVMPWHKTDLRGLADDAAFADLIRRQNLTPGLYSSPYASTPEARKSPEMAQRFEKGPVAILTVRKAGGMGMGPMLAQWAVFLLVISVSVAYLSGRTLPPTESWIGVFRVAGTFACFSYAAAIIPNAIFWGRPWSVAWKEVFDGFLYGLITAAIFAWFWPR
ncbi:MAG TPA: hypothetical protein VEI06_17520 [Gemmatimonadaceae bacterium]|nr:hypothetical protein [Gemmatimonadaceae bacterium]